MLGLHYVVSSAIVDISIGRLPFFFLSFFFGWFVLGFQSVFRSVGLGFCLSWNTGLEGGKLVDGEFAVPILAFKSGGGFAAGGWDLLLAVCEKLDWV